ncbi:hypothetical protein TUM3794_19380 [Shewanella colwelliana]|uniref:Sulfotransferase n=1 Tax=Shewanella colwelliana TaxID=23 RepID=A0ABQ4NZZ1_SHECO|nr:sulfotransferase [Shewanella colwelliana]GIU40738.1 hypothetical protein TUM3794_19380 [Shewanella colwelliana]
MSREVRNLEEARAFYSQGKYSSAGIYARKVVRRAPDNGEALAILGHLAFRSRDVVEAKNHYCQALANGFENDEVLNNLVVLSENREDYFTAYQTLARLVAKAPQEIKLQFRLGLNASRIGKMDEAEQALSIALAGGEQTAQASLNLGHVYKAKGNTAKAAQLYHDYIALDPQNQATGYWSLADLKNYRFTESDEQALTTNVASAQFSAASQSLFHFALNRIYEQHQDYGKAFDAAKRANQLMQPLRPFKVQPFTDLVQRLLASKPLSPIQTTSAQKSLIPIFIVGMPRSGTTLSEQILASHSLVEATDELPYMERLALELEMAGGYSRMLSQLPPEKIAAMRASYLAQASQYLPKEQQASARYIIDKNPNNFMHIGLIKVLFPEAKIINVIRDAADNGLGVYKQHFSRGHDYSYSLEHICLYWQAYLQLMSHWQNCFAGDIYHLCFESLVHDPDAQIPAMLDYCGLGFEESCLRFYESTRTVLTPSASQVRRPMNKKAIGQSEHYQPYMADEYQTLKDITAKAHQLFLT